MNMIATLVPTVRLDCDATTGMQKQGEVTMTTRVEPGVLEVAWTLCRFAVVVLKVPASVCSGNMSKRRWNRTVLRLPAWILVQTTTGT